MRDLLLGVVVGLLWIGMADAKPDPDRAGRELAEATAGARGTTCKYDADALAVRCEDGNITYLSNFWDEYQRAPRGERKALVERWATMVVEPPSVPEELGAARDNLMPRVKSRFDHYYLRALGELEGKELPTSDTVGVTEHLAADVVYDLPEAMMSLNPGQADAWGTTPEELLEIAVAVLGEEMAREEGVYPPRWRVDGFGLGDVGQSLVARSLTVEEILPPE